jgi:hypothetical protein
MNSVLIRAASPNMYTSHFELEHARLCFDVLSADQRQLSEQISRSMEATDVPDSGCLTIWTAVMVIIGGTSGARDFDIRVWLCERHLDRSEKLSSRITVEVHRPRFVRALRHWEQTTKQSDARRRA